MCRSALDPAHDLRQPVCVSIAIFEWREQHVHMIRHDHGGMQNELGSVVVQAVR
jgi:hypothetical protein